MVCQVPGNSYAIKELKQLPGHAEEFELIIKMSAT